jgi:deferrochelatase/peroxidase EfeB
MFDAALREFMGAEWLDYKTTALKRSATVTKPDPAAAPSTSVRLEEIQASVLNPYAKLHHAEVLFFRLDTSAAGADFLAQLAPRVTTGNVSPEVDALNVTLSFSGFRALGFASAALSALPDEFRVGMAGRAAQLGDGDLSLPDFWTPPLAEGSSNERLSLEAVDVVVFAQAATASRLAELVRDVEQLAERAEVTLLGREHSAREFDANGGELEPFFGYRDGISQPPIAELGHGSDAGKPVALGELVLGAPNTAKRRACLPGLDALGLGELYDHGSFVALRRFERAPQAGGAVSELELAQRFGRRRDGSALVESNGGNAFDYSADRAGKTCPFAAHARRANPRFAQPHPEGVVPRIVRRALPTRGPASSEPGLMFLAFNASLAQQYEVLQLWLNSGNIIGGFSTDSDPIAGSSGGVSFFTRVDAVTGRLRTTPVQAPLRVAWGMYLFQPSRTALANLGRHATASRATKPATWPLRHAHGRELDGSDVQTLERCLSESPTKATAAEAVWDEVKAAGGVARSAYGVLVENRELVLDVFARDGRDFSVMEYGRRMENALGKALFLGEDYGAQRPQALERANRVFQAPATVAYVRERTRQIMVRLIERARKEPRPDGEAPGVKLMQILPEVLPVVVAEVYGFAWSASEAAKALGIAVDLASFIFNPHVAALGCPAQRGPATTESGVRIEQIEKQHGAAMKALCARHSEAASPIATVIAGMAELASVDALTSLVLGTMAPTTGTYSSLVKYWVGEAELGRVRSRVLDTRGAGHVDRARFHQELLRAMQRTPMPSILYRRVLSDTTLGGATLRAGELVMLRISATPEEHRPGSLGFVYGHGVHQCPGIDISLALLSEVFISLLEQPNARARPGKGEIAFDN